MANHLANAKYSVPESFKQACTLGDLKWITSYIQGRANRGDVNFKERTDPGEYRSGDHMFLKWLELACQHGNLEIIKYLLSLPPLLHDAETAFSMICDQDFQDRKDRKDRNDNPDGQETVAIKMLKWINGSRKLGISMGAYKASLENACYRGNINIVRYLVDFEHLHKIDPSSSIAYACMYEYIDVAKILFDKLTASNMPDGLGGLGGPDEFDDSSSFKGPNNLGDHSNDYFNYATHLDFVDIDDLDDLDLAGLIGLRKVLAKSTKPKLVINQALQKICGKSKQCVRPLKRGVEFLLECGATEFKELEHDKRISVKNLWLNGYLSLDTVRSTWPDKVNQFQKIRTIIQSCINTYLTSSNLSDIVLTYNFKS